MEHIGLSLERIMTQWDAQTAVALLAHIDCPVCGVTGSYETFRHETANHVGLKCRACNCRHPFGPHWLRQGAPVRSNDVRKVMAERGAYCWLCGCSYELLRSHGIGMHVHHSQPFAEHGDRVEKIPLCALCHEIATAVQRHHGRLLVEEG